MAYSAITNGEIDTDSPVTTGLMTKIRDNIDAMKDATGIDNDAILGRHYWPGSVDEAAIGNGAVHQAEMDVGSEEDTNTSNGFQTYLTSAGQYNLSVEFKCDHFGIGSDPINQYDGVHSYTVGDIASYGHYITLGDSSDFTSTSARTTYINASAPFDLGDGEIRLFVWVLMRSNKIIAISSSEAPPWAYNGPTNLKPTRKIKDRITRELKKYRTVKAIDEENGSITETEVEIDQAFKNADMPLFPHPFASAQPGDVVVLLDPPGVGELREIRDTGESINDLMVKDYLRIKNDTIVRSVPPGVAPSLFQWKNTRRKAGEMVRDRRLKQGPFRPIN